MKSKRTIFFTILIAALSVFLFAGCNANDAEQPEEMIDYEIAFITDEGLINDRGTSEEVWNTITEFASSKGLSHKYYKATQAKENAVREVLDSAVEKGAKIVIADNSAIADIIFDIQDDYKGVDFVTINADPYDANNGDILIRKNTTAITFATEQAGYMAGYAAVKEGYSDLGTIVQGEDKMMAGFQYGFAKGANRAAREEYKTVSVKCATASGGDAKETASEKAAKWYKAGTEVIFVCGDKIEGDVIEEAEVYERKVIGGITDKGEMSDTVLISAVEDIDIALTGALQNYVRGEFTGGEVSEYDASLDGVYLEYKNSRMEHFEKQEFDALLDRIKSKKIRINIDGIESLDDLDLENVDLKY